MQKNPKQNKTTTTNLWITKLKWSVGKPYNKKEIELLQLGIIAYKMWLYVLSNWRKCWDSFCSALFWWADEWGCNLSLTSISAVCATDIFFPHPTFSFPLMFVSLCVLSLLLFGCLQWFGMGSHPDQKLKNIDRPTVHVLKAGLIPQSDSNRDWAQAKEVGKTHREVVVMLQIEYCHLRQYTMSNYPW